MRVLGRTRQSNCLIGDVARVTRSRLNYLSVNIKSEGLSMLEGDENAGVMTDRPKNCINTFVAVDLETTGLPSMEYNKTKITEIALVAASRENLLNTMMGIPRVTHKLTLCVNPFRMINPVATNITGLSNDILEKEKYFDSDTCHMINLFLSRLTPPVCLIAHNGMKFDFPILKSEIEQSQMVVADDLLCTDSLIAFRELFSEIPHEMLPRYMQKRLNSSQSQRKVMDVVEHKECECMDSIIVKSIEKDSRSLMQKINETTPKQAISQSQRKVMDVVEHKECECMDSIIVESIEKDSRSLMQKINETTPKQAIPQTTIPCTPVLKVIKAKRRLFTKENEEVQPPLESFKLQDIYKFISGREAGDVHKAENDALLIIACMTGMGEDFIKWADDNAILFSDVRKIR